MPSKQRKQAKTPSKAPPSSETCDGDTGLLLQLLEEASERYPSLIAKTAFVGAVAELDHQSNGSTVWLSETSMVVASFAHGSLVSVSLPCLSGKYSETSPLSSLSDEFASHVGSNLLYRFTDEPGNYFALAKLCCSSKVAKDEVRLSSSLSRTLGGPTVGKPVFICPIKDGISSSNPFSVYNCSELYLELIHHQQLSTTNNSSKIASETSFSFSNGVSGSSSPMTPVNQMKASSYVTSQSQLFSSPKTPVNQIKASSTVTSQLSSSVCNNSFEELTESNGLSTVSFNITELLGEEGVAKRLVDTWATPWLYSWSLLRGNLVTIPILSQLCTFQVVGAKTLLDRNSSIGNGNDLIEASESSERSIDAFLVQRETKVSLGLPSRLQSKSPEGQSSFNLESGFQTDTEDDYVKLGGLSAEYNSLMDIILSLSQNTLSSVGLRSTKGVLLHGPPGTGKTSLALSCIRDAKVNLFSVNGPEIVTQNYGESEQALQEVFESAHRAAPAVIFIDELDGIAPARKEGGEGLSHRMVATLLYLMDGIGRSESILVIAATNSPDSIEPALRRPGRLDKEIEIGVPSPKQRLDILQSCLCDMEHSLLDTQVKDIANSTHGFVGADLGALVNEAALICLLRNGNLRTQTPLNDSYAISRADCSEGSGEILIDYLDSATSEESMLKVTFDDFEKAKMIVRPSAMREVILEVPKVRWEDVGGQREVKSQLMEAVEWPQKLRDEFKSIGTRPPMGVLLYGPPGCSKTLLARAVASEAGLNFLAVKGPELFSKWVGESEKAVRSLFAKARANSPSIIFFDEIDGLASIRGKESDGVSVSDRVMSQLLVEMDGLHQRLDVTVIAATNRPDKIDSALLRPGRFDRVVYVGPPNGCDREEIFRIHLRKTPCSADVSIADLSSLTECFTGADISSVCRNAALKALEENLDALEITMQHLKASIEETPPSSTRSYQEIIDRVQRLVVAQDT